MGDTKTEFLDAAKLILGIENDESDALISLIISDTVDAVLAYCRLDVLPRQLTGFIPTLAAKRFRENQCGGIKAITEGERRVEYENNKENFLAEYADRLKPFVSREAKVPSDLGDTKND